MKNTHTSAYPTTRYQTTEYNRSERLLSRLQDIYGRARSFHMSHAEILERLDAEIYKTRDWGRLKSYYRGYFAGFHRAIAKELYRYLDWRVYFRGALVKSEEVPPGYWSEVESDKGQHVWADAPERIF